MMSLMSMSELTKSSYLKEHPVDDNRMSEIKHKSGFKLPDLFKFARAGRTPDLLRCLSDAMENEPNAKGVVDRRCLITGRAVLHEAACFGHRTVIDLLCRDFQANINNKTLMGGDTALHFAAMKNQRAVCFHLITTYGADPEIKNKFGFTPLHYAAMYGSYSLVKCLCQYGAKTATETNEGQTAAQIAHARGAQEEMIDFFLKLAETEGRGDFLEMLEGKKAEMAEEAGAYTAQKVLIQEMEYDKFSKKTMKEYAAWKQPERPSKWPIFPPLPTHTQSTNTN